jgi:hypothetical protein
MTDTEDQERSEKAALDPKLALAVLDAMFYAQAVVEPFRQALDVHAFVDKVLAKAGRADEVERSPAVAVNASIAAAFVDALADYGYVVTPVAEVTQ